MREAKPSYSAFRGHTRLASGELEQVAVAIRKLADAGDPSLVLIFDDANGRQIDVDLGGSLEDVARRFGSEALGPNASAAGSRGPGRPKLGVVGHEVTLLPRHWEWLQSQRGGPSATLRRLVDEARSTGRERDRLSQAQDAINRFISAVAGDLAGFEEANRALYRGERERFQAEIARWPSDVRSYTARWAEAAFGTGGER